MCSHVCELSSVDDHADSLNCTSLPTQGPLGDQGFACQSDPSNRTIVIMIVRLSFSARLLSAVTGATQKQCATSCTCICWRATQSCLRNRPHLLPASDNKSPMRGSASSHWPLALFLR